MKILFTGTGTSQGVPVICCQCDVCISGDERNKRLRTSIFISDNNVNIVVDAGPDFRQQMLRAGVSRLDAVLFTHEHKDHIAGLDDVRAFNFKQRISMPVYCTAQVEQALRREYAYAFAENPYPGAPSFDMHQIKAGQDFQIGDLNISPFMVWHAKMPVTAYRIKNFVYITDANAIDRDQLKYLKGADVLVLNALRHNPHHSHYTLQEAIDLAREVEAKKVYFTHISHLLGLHQVVDENLPENMYLAYDGLELDL